MTIYEYILAETNRYQTTPVPIADGYEWNMYQHVRRSFLYKHSKFWKGENDGNRPFRNIILPVLNVAYRSEGFDVKDIQPFVRDPQNYHKSFLVKKFHPRWARENNIDTFIDELVESYTDYGLVLVKNVNDVRPEVVPLTRLAFCDQTDIMSGPICEKHYYSADQLRESKWDKDKIDELITMAQPEKEVGIEGKAETPGNYIELYELHGQFPQDWLDDSGSQEIVGQMHIVGFYATKDGSKSGVTLFRGKEPKTIYKAKKRGNIWGRACGWGGVEELFEPQTWVNFSEIQQKEMLELASLLIFQTADAGLAKRQKITNSRKGEILLYKDGNRLEQVSMTVQNEAMFNNATTKWEQNARTLGSANDAVLGESPSSGTPFKLQELVVQEGQGIHEYRRGQIITFVDEIYRDWVLSYLIKELKKGDEWLDELSLDEMRWVSDKIALNQAKKKVKEALLSGKTLTQEHIDLIYQISVENFKKEGSRKFIKIMEKEFDKLPIEVEINIKNKQKNLGQYTDKLVNVFRQILASPQILQTPGMDELFNQIIESSGLDPVDFSGFTQSVNPIQPSESKPLEELTQKENG